QQEPGGGVVGGVIPRGLPAGQGLLAVDLLLEPADLGPQPLELASLGLQVHRGTDLLWDLGFGVCPTLKSGRTLSRPGPRPCGSGRTIYRTATSREGVAAGVTPGSGLRMPFCSRPDSGTLPCRRVSATLRT